MGRSPIAGWKTMHAMKKGESAGKRFSLGDNQPVLSPSAAAQRATSPSGQEHGHP